MKTYIMYCLCKVGFLISSMLSIYLEAAYLIVILPNANAFKHNPQLLTAIVAINYVLAICLYILHAYSFCCVSWCNPGYFKDYYTCNNMGTVTHSNADDIEG